MESCLHHRIQTKAYELWESAGKPLGKSMDFWLQAEKIISSQMLEEIIMRSIDIKKELTDLAEELMIRDFFSRVEIPEEKSPIGYIKTDRQIKIRNSKIYDTSCPRCESDDMVLRHPNAINSHACARCLIEWDTDGNIRNLEDGEILEEL